MDGWIKLHRSLLEWEWWDDISTARLWLVILLTANHNTKKWHGMTIEAGQFVTSINKLAISSGLTKQQVRTSLDKLIHTGEITRKTTNRYTVITVVKWGNFQVSDSSSNKQNNTQITHKQQTNNKQITTTKNDKKYKNEKNKYITIQPPQFILDQMAGNLPDDTPATAEDIELIKQLQKGCA